MTRNRLMLSFAMLLGLGAAAPASAQVVVTAGIVAPIPRIEIVVARPPPPAPNYVWVESYVVRDAYGVNRRVAAHWRRPTVRPGITRVVHRRSAPRTRVVRVMR